MKAILIAIAIGLGVCLAILLVPLAARDATPEAERLCAIVRACQSETHVDVAVLGNSVGMFGINARRLGRRAWNFCSPAQSPAEAQLIEEQLPSQTATLVQLVTPFQLADGDGSIDREKLAAMYSCGCHLAGVTPLDARPLVRSRIERAIRDRFWPHDEEWRIARDLQFPAPAENDANAGGWRASDRWAIAEVQRAQPSAGQLARLRAEVAGAQRRGRRVVIVLAPLHPRLIAQHGGEAMIAAFGRSVAAAAPGARVVDLTHLLTAEEFRDATHPTLAGAQRLTTTVRDLL